MTVPVSELTPEGRRKAILRDLCLEETFLTYLRELGPVDARWVIQHEHKAHIKWIARRTQWLMDEYGTGETKQPRPRVIDEERTPPTRFHRPTGTRYGQRV